ncbi:hypothetical protein DFR50_110116 [Roseiarcus fermentans]|uniref:Uncharacterized protein n=1 Tax=Roseiarcus fermentans TaxID=1473586 RepID=A0A366FHL4_9HYPH|nr:hypothetical protein [Roseiarcus fermentans]RBP14091.1 hypothetical protein DFR50_110116 [Roseiarcus fermentans]
MSWDVYFVHFENELWPPVDPKPVLAVFERYCETLQRKEHGYDCKLRDGLEIEIYSAPLDGSEPFDGPMFAFRGFTPVAARFLYEAAVAGQATVIAPGITCLVEETKDTDLPKDLRKSQPVIHVGDADELYAALTEGFDGWRRYRDHVVGR